MPGGTRYLLLILLTALLSVLCTRLMRRIFTRFRSRELKAGKELIYRHFPRHKKPLGGGIAIFTALLGGALLALLFFPASLTPTVWVCITCGLAFAGIGFIDDWRKVNAAKGLNERTKLLMQLLLAFLFTALIVLLRGDDPREALSLFLPFVGTLTLGNGWLFLPLGMLVIIGMTNAVNLTDGLDGLAGSALAIAFGGYLALSLLLGHRGVPVMLSLLVLCALVGFLLQNRPPAKIIMGDTGALGLGAMLGALALLSRTEWLLLLVAAPFVIDTLSVLIQITVIKFFRGPVKLLRHQTTEIFRPFLCTPLHHHFQWLTWGPWPILALFGATGILCTLLALLAYAVDGSPASAWLWVAGLALQAAFLLFAAGQKMLRATYFFGLERVEDRRERMLALYKGLPMEVLGIRCYELAELTEISEHVVHTLVAETLLWRNISEIEAHATLGKIYAENKMFDRAAEEWEAIPVRNLLIRDNLVVQLGKIYYGREELLRAIKLWEQLPPSRLAAHPGLLETISSAKVRVGHLAGRLYHQARERARGLQQRTEAGGTPVPAELRALIGELDGALRYTQDLRDLLTYEQGKSEELGELDDADGPQLYRRMDALLTVRREELHEALQWAHALTAPAETDAEDTPLQSLTRHLQLTPVELTRALGISGRLDIRAVEKIDKPSRNRLFRLRLGERDSALPECLIAKCYDETQISFFSACYRRERGVLQLLAEADAPVPTPYGGYLGTRQGVIFLEDLGGVDLSSTLRTLAPGDRAGRIAWLQRAIDTLVLLRTRIMPVLPRMEREISKIVKEVLTREYYRNCIAIALNRILALERRQLSRADYGRLETALQPLTAVLLEEPKTFIHFEFTPGNLQVADGRITPLDFEQSTMGPAAFDLATLLYGPEVDLLEEEVAALADYYHESLPAEAPIAFAVSPEALQAASIVKLLFYAGSAANFYRKFEEGQRLIAMEWYIQAAERALLRTPAYHDLAHLLRACWSGQHSLGV